MGRLRGESDLIYIGECDLRARLKAHVSSRPDFEDKGWLLTLIAKRLLGLEVRCFRSDYTERDEAELLLTYFKEHLELPPANRSTPKTPFAIAYLSFMSLDAEDQDWVRAQFPTAV